MPQDRSLDVLAVIRAPLEQYPPSINQVGLLADAGLKVGVVDLSHLDYRWFPFEGRHNVERFQDHRHIQSHKEKLPSLPTRLFRAWRFGRRINRVIEQRRPKVVIAYDPNAMWGVGPLWKRTKPPKLVWHFHELSLPPAISNRILQSETLDSANDSTGSPLTPSLSSSNGEKTSNGPPRRCFVHSSLTAKAVQFASEHAHDADLVVFPDRGRADIFAQAVGLARPAQMVMNCPRRRPSLPENLLVKRLEELGHKDARAVYFHGWIGPSRCIETLIESIKFWPPNVLLVLVGPVAQSYRQTLENLANEVGVARRVLFLGMVPHSEIWSLAVGAMAGVSLVADDSDLNWSHSAGAINKRFEYMSVGLPQVANLGRGMADIIERRSCGVLVNPKSSEELGRAVAGLLRNEDYRQRMAANARSAHLDEFNYERQFERVQEMIFKWCEDKIAG